MLKELKIQKLLEITSEVVYGYKYKDFNFVVMNDRVANASLRVRQEDVYEYILKKTELKDIVQAPKGYFGI